MIEYWKKIFKDSWVIYLKNWKLIIGSVILSFLPIILIAFIPTQIMNIESVNSSLNIIEILQSLHISIILVLVSIAILIGGLLLGALKIVYKLIKGQPASIKEILTQFHLLPKIFLIYVIVGILMYFLNRLELSVVAYIFNLIFSSLIPFYVLIVLTKNLKLMDSIKHFYIFVKSNVISIIQFIFINIVFGLIMGVLMLAVGLTIPFLMVPMLLFILFSYIFLIVVVQIQFYVQIEQK